MLRDHIAALELMRTEICFKNTPMDDNLALLSKHCQKETVRFYQCAFENALSGLAFSTAAEQQYDMLKKDGLTDEDIEGIRIACRVLGQYDSIAQEEQLAVAVEHLKRLLDVLEKEVSSKGRIYKTAGATVGIVLALMVI